MKWGVVGAGAMGCLLGAFLKKAGEEVWLVDIWEDHVNEIRKQGVTLLIEGKTEVHPLTATTDPREVGVCGAVIVSTKSLHTRNAVQNALSMITDETVVMTLQNGIGNVEIISEFVNPKQILYGLTTLGSVVKGPGKIEATFAYQADTYAWTLVGQPDHTFQSVIDAFSRAGLRFTLTPDVRERVWKKLCVNAGFSLPLAIPKLRCGDFVDQPSSLGLIRGLVNEIVEVGRREGVHLDAEETYTYVVTLAQMARGHMTSPLLDVLNRRKTEVDALNGAIVAKAKQHGIEVPYNTTIYHLIRIIENTYDKTVLQI